MKTYNIPVEATFRSYWRKVESCYPLSFKKVQKERVN